jgi:hypothetical protein
MCLSSEGSSSGSLKPGRIIVSGASIYGKVEGETGRSGKFRGELGSRGETKIEG